MRGECPLSDSEEGAPGDTETQPEHRSAGRAGAAGGQCHGGWCMQRPWEGPAEGRQGQSLQASRLQKGYMDDRAVGVSGDGQGGPGVELGVRCAELRVL